MEGLQGGEIARVFDKHSVTRVNHHGGEHVQRLLGAVCDDNLGSIHVDALFLIAVGNELTQRSITLCTAVLQRHDTVFFEDLVGSNVHRGDRERNRIRQAAGKGDDIRVRIRFEDIRKEVRLEVRL